MNIRKSFSVRASRGKCTRSVPTDCAANTFAIVDFIRAPVVVLRFDISARAHTSDKHSIVCELAKVRAVCARDGISLQRVQRTPHSTTHPDTG